MFIREIITAFKVPFNLGPESDDFQILSNRYVYHLMKVARSLLLYQKLKDPLFNYRFSLQTLDCIKLIPTEKNECVEKLPSGCKWLKSEKPIPGTINDIITNVYNDRGDKYTRILSESSKSFKRYSYGEDNHYNYLIKNNYLYVPNLNSPKWIKIEGLFYDEDKVKEYCNCNCDLLDSEFSLEERLIKPMKDIMYAELFKAFPYMKTDNKNNTTDDKEKS